jgi:thioredoxin reductase
MYDVIVIGGGPAGLSAALMLGRCRRRVLMCDLGEPRNRQSTALHGYLTRDGISPTEFNELGRAELTRYGIECRHAGVTGVVDTGSKYVATLSTGGKETARYLLIATGGVVDDLPAIPAFTTLPDAAFSTVRATAGSSATSSASRRCQLRASPSANLWAAT